MSEEHDINTIKYGQYITIKPPRFRCPTHGDIGQNVWSVWATHRTFGPFCLDCVGEKLVEIVGVAEKME